MIIYNDEVEEFSFGKYGVCNQEIEYNTSCVPLKCNVEWCLLCCSSPPFCCFCYNYDVCWGKDWSLITASQIIVILLFVFGIFFVIVMYFRICSRLTQIRYRGRNTPRNERNNVSTDSNTSNCYNIQDFRERPPPYNEACSAPPLYGSPYNRVSMLEAPPVYPETPKLSDRVLQSANSPKPSIAHHI